MHVLAAHSCWARPCAAQVLKPHQVEGVRWIFSAIHRGGGIIADDPGLGKTLQVITVLEAPAARVCRRLEPAAATASRSSLHTGLALWAGINRPREASPHT